MGVTRIETLTAEQRARFDEWADRWIAIGLRTGAADRAQFEQGARDCYRYAGILWPGRVIWVSSPLVLALAAPAAAYIRQWLRSPNDAVHDAVHGAVRDEVSGAVDGAVRSAVDGAVRSAVQGAVQGAVRSAVDGAVQGAVGDEVGDAVRSAVRDEVGDAVRSAVHDAVHGAVRDEVDGAVDGAVGDAVGDAVRSAVHGAVHGAVGDAVQGVRTTIRQSWSLYLGGQFWVGYGWFWGPAYASYFREVCALDLPGDLWDRARTYEATTQHACWWWPHRDFVMVCEHPTVIQRELVDPSRARGWNSHRLHCDEGPAVAWPDGWGVWAIHGVRVTQQIVEAPETLTPQQIVQEPNAEVRRIMLTRFGEARLLAELHADPVHTDEYGTLYQIPLENDEPLTMVRVLNSTPEHDGAAKPYWLRVDPELRPMHQDGTKGRPQKMTARNAIASTFGLRGAEYAPTIET